MEKINKTDIPHGPHKGMTCPHCKFKKHELLFNGSLGFFACSKCGRMFMDPVMVKELLELTKDPPMIITSGNARMN